MGGFILASLPGHPQIFLHSCEIKSGSSLGTRLGSCYDLDFYKYPNYILQDKKKLHTHCLFNGVVGLVTLALWEGAGFEDPHRPLRVETLLPVGGEGEQPCANKVTPAYRVRQKAIIQIHFVEGGLLTLASVTCNTQ